MCSGCGGEYSCYDWCPDAQAARQRFDAVESAKREFDIRLNERVRVAKDEAAREIAAWMLSGHVDGRVDLAAAILRGEWRKR